MTILLQKKPGPARHDVRGLPATFGSLGVSAPLDAAGVTVPFPIKAVTLPDALAGRDILGQGRAGSGKTLGYSLPLVARLAGGHIIACRPRGLVLLPTRELASQVRVARLDQAEAANAKDEVDRQRQSPLADPGYGNGFTGQGTAGFPGMTRRSP